jgi:hypothetical protein
LFFSNHFLCFSEWYELQHVTVCLMDPNGMLDHRIPPLDTLLAVSLTSDDDLSRWRGSFWLNNHPVMVFGWCFWPPNFDLPPFFGCFWGLVFSAVQSRPGL